MALCFYNLRMYEDAIEYCDMILAEEKKNIKTSLIKAKSLAFLHEFEESRKIFKEVKFEKELNFVSLLEEQHRGDFHKTIPNVK